MSFFEYFYNNFNLIKLKAPGSIYKKYAFHLWLNRLNTNPDNIFSSVTTLTLFSIIIYFILSFVSFQFAFSLFISLLILSFYFAYYPIFYTQVVRIQVTSEIVWIILYLSLYLKRNPNLENGIKYVAYYMKGYIATDFKSLLYNLETNKFTDIESALEYYQRRWFYLSPDFVYAMTHIVNIKYKTSIDDINKLLDRILGWVLKKSLEKSQLYVDALKEPATVIISFLVMMPIVSLMMLPIVSVFLLNTVSFYFIAFSYIIILPVITFLIIQNFLSKNPFAFSVPDLSLARDLPKPGKFKIGNKEVPAIIISIILGSIAVLGIYHLISLAIKITFIPQGFLSDYLNIVYQDRALIYSVLTLTLPLGLGLGIGSYYYLTSFQKVKKIYQIEEIENEFPIVVYEFASLLEDGYPFEIVIEKTYYNYRIIKSSGVMENFLKTTLYNLRKGYDLNTSVFDPKIGSLNLYPSKLVRESMQLLVTSASKGPEVLSKIAYNVSTNLENVDNIRYNVRKILNEIIGLIDMTSRNLVPLISAMVTVFNNGIVSMLFALAYFFQLIEQSFGLGGGSSLFNFIVTTFNLYNLIPPTFFEAIIGIFFIEYVVITSYMSAGIKYGFDSTMTSYYIGRNLLFGTIFYVIFSIIGILVVYTVFGPYLPTNIQL
ncbi:MAG: hypothetical protein GU343_02795 [Nanoarchaeota archaeon]|jgi:hypothetical protein|nr:hypothetical protein [Nanoarchaeota archaeon]